MKLTVQKRLASQILKCSPSRVWIDPEKVQDVKEAITSQDIKSLINNGLIVKKQKDGQSGFHSKKILAQKRKGQRKGHGSRKGKSGARTHEKTEWINRIRLQRAFMQDLKKKGLIDSKNYRMVAMRIKGGFFRSKRHIKIFINEKGIIKNEKSK